MGVFKKCGEHQFAATPPFCLSPGIASLNDIKRPPTGYATILMAALKDRLNHDLMERVFNFDPLWYDAGFNQIFDQGVQPLDRKSVV